MTKAGLVSMLSKSMNIPKQDAKVIVNTIFASISEALAKGEKVELRGFGSFRMKERAARTGRNPRTGEEVHVPKKWIPHFKAGKVLREAINEER